MGLLSPVVVRSLTYAGLISNALAIVACLAFWELDPIPWKSMDLSLWILNFYIHKKRGTW